MSKKIISTLCGFLCSAILAGCVSLPPQRPAIETAGSEQYSAPAAYHYSMAVLLRLDGDLPGALRELQQALANHPDSPYLITDLISLYVENNNMDLALSLGESAVAQNPGHVDLRSIMGGLYFHTGAYDKAIREYQTVIDLDPDNQVAYLYLATVYAQDKKYDLAENAYQKLLKIDPENVIGMYSYAKTLMQMSRWADAESLFRKITNQRPAFEAGWLGLGGLYENQKKYDEAIEVYRRYAEMNPARIHFRVKMAELLKKANRPEEAKKEFQDVLKIVPANREVRIALGLLYYDLRQFKEAADEFSLLLETAPDDDKLLYLSASALEQKGDLPAALVHYQKISPSFDLYANAQIHAAMLLKKSKRLDEAISVMVRAMEKKSDEALLYLYLSSLYEDQKDMARAEATVLEGLQHFPRNTDLHYVLGTILEKTNRFEASIKSMEKVLEIDPKNADALNFIGYTYADRGIHLDQAEQMIVQALKIKPDNGYILDSLGWVHFKKNKYASALKHLRKALEFLPEDPSIMEHLGDVYLKTGRPKEALDYYRRAIKIIPDNGALKTKIDDLMRSH